MRSKAESNKVMTVIDSDMRILLQVSFVTSVCLKRGGFVSLLPLPQNFSVNSFYINWLHMGQDWSQLMAFMVEQLEIKLADTG
jgi:hypothetical protein